MGLYVRKDEQRSKLQERIASELREKARAAGDDEKPPVVDGVDDSGYMQKYQKLFELTGRLAGSFGCRSWSYCCVNCSDDIRYARN